MYHSTKWPWPKITLTHMYLYFIGGTYKQAHTILKLLANSGQGLENKQGAVTNMARSPAGKLSSLSIFFQTGDLVTLVTTDHFQNLISSADSCDMISMFVKKIHKAETIFFRGIWSRSWQHNYLLQNLFSSEDSCNEYIPKVWKEFINNFNLRDMVGKPLLVGWMDMQSPFVYPPDRTKFGDNNLCRIVCAGMCITSFWNINFLQKQVKCLFCAQYTG